MDAQKFSYPWHQVPPDQRSDYVAALAAKFLQVHFTGYRRAQIKDVVKKQKLLTPHPSGIGRHKSGRLVYQKDAPWIPISQHENGLIKELMRLDLLFVKEND